MPSKFEKFKGIVKSFMSSRARGVGASEMPQNFMGVRKKKLDMMGGRNPGGMFDIIYKKRKEREDALRGIE